MMPPDRRRDNIIIGPVLVRPPSRDANNDDRRELWEWFDDGRAAGLRW
jgi:hypothetical protein